MSVYCRDCLHDEMCCLTHCSQSVACCMFVNADRYNEIMQADREGRLVILPCGENAELTRNGKTYKGDHWNHVLTAFRDDQTARSEKQVALFSIEEAEKALADAQPKDPAFNSGLHYPTGSTLDAFAEVVGLQREPGESDADFLPRVFDAYGKRCTASLEDDLRSRLEQ